MMKQTIALLVFLLLATSVNADDVDFDKGIFVVSFETTVTGPHGIKGRRFVTAEPPTTTGYKPGWNYNKRGGQKEGLQLYLDKNYLSVEYFEKGEKISTATYRQGEPNGWFYRYDANRKKHGLQHYFDGSYQSTEEYVHGKKVASGVYRRGEPDGWFYTYEHGKKQGRQTYVDGNYWSIETYLNGKKDGLSGSYRRGKKDGWHYTYKMGTQVHKVYYANGVVQ